VLPVEMILTSLRFKQIAGWLSPDHDTNYKNRVKFNLIKFLCSLYWRSKNVIMHQTQCGIRGRKPHFHNTFSGSSISVGSMDHGTKLCLLLLLLVSLVSFDFYFLHSMHFTQWIIIPRLNFQTKPLSTRKHQGKKVFVWIILRNKYLSNNIT